MNKRSLLNFDRATPVDWRNFQKRRPPWTGETCSFLSFYRFCMFSFFRVRFIIKCDIKSSIDRTAVGDWPFKYGYYLILKGKRPWT